MSISAVSSSSSIGLAGQSSTNIDTAIARIQKQISQVQKQMTDENNSKDDAKTKTELMQSYLIELTALQAQLTQLQIQKAKDSTASGDETEKPVAQSASSATNPNPVNLGLSRYLNRVV